MFTFSPYPHDVNETCCGSEVKQLIVYLESIMFYAMCEPGDIEDKTTLNCYGVDCPYCYGALSTIDRQVRLHAYGDTCVTFAKAVVDTALTLGANYDAIKRMFVDWLRGSRDLGGLSTKRGTHMYNSLTYAVHYFNGLLITNTVHHHKKRWQTDMPKTSTVIMIQTQSIISEHNQIYQTMELC